MSKIVIKNLEKSFGENKVINNFNIDIKDGEFIVLVGPSGCGKSTLLRMVSGLESIDQGEIFLDTKLINNLIPSKREIAMVFQSYALYPHMNVFENMSFGLKMEKISKNEINEKVNHAATTLQIEDLLDRKPKQLSGGQRQRVAIGRAITRNPKVFLFDEPLSNLDAALRSEMRVEISKLHKKLNSNIIYVTHDQVEAMTLADRVVVMNNGKIQQIGSPKEIYNRPFNTFVASFIGSPPMNLIPISRNSENKTKTISFDETITLCNSFMELDKRNLIIFPEGSRGKPNVMKSFRKGAARFSLALNKPIVPIYIDGSSKSWPKGKIFMRPCKITINILEPIDPNDYISNQNDNVLNAKQLTTALEEKFMKEITVEGAQLALEIGPILLKELKKNEFPLMFNILETICNNKKLSINW